MENKKMCGSIMYKETKYNVYLELGTDKVWIEKPNDKTFGLGNYNNRTARNESEALEVAKLMLVETGN